MKSLDVAALDRAALYRLLTGLIVPRPIAWVSSVSRSGINNLAAFSFFTVVGNDPPLIGFSCNMTKPRGLKDTQVNIQETGEFVVNIVDRDTLVRMEQSAEPYPPEVDEFVAAGLTPAWDTLRVKAPRVAESPAQFECRHERTVDFGEYAFIVGEVLAVHMREGLTDQRLRVDFEAFQWVGRLTGGQYCEKTPGFRVSEGGEH